MREILFKAKTTSKEKGEFNNVWVEGELITSNGKYYIHPKSNSVNVKNELGKIIVMHEVMPDTICQYTGLNDNNGNKIWENDVILIKESYIPNCPFSVRYNNKTASFVGFYDECLKKFGLNKDLLEHSEVIGSIFANPKLIGEQNG